MARPAIGSPNAIGDRVELIDGQVLAMTPIDPRHSAALGRANRALVLAAGDDAIVLPGDRSG